MPLLELIPAGSRGTKQTLIRMTQLAARAGRDWRFIKAMSRLVNSLPARAARLEMDRLLNFVKHQVRYQRDPLTAPEGYVELVQSPQQTLARGAGDCVPLSQRLLVADSADGAYKVLPAGELRNQTERYRAVSYNALTKRFEQCRISRWLYKGRRPVVKVRLRSGQEFRCTPDHKLWLVLKDANKHPACYRLDRRKLSETLQYSKSYCKGLATAHCLPAQGLTQEPSNAQLFLEGLYAAEGYAEHPYKAEISNKNDEIIARTASCLASLGVPFRVRERKDGVKLVYVKASWLSRRLHSLFGRDSFSKQFPDEYLNLSQEALEIILSAYAAGDAYTPSGGDWQRKAVQIYNTSSTLLAEQTMLMHLILGRPLSPYFQRKHGGLGARPIWRLVERKNHTHCHVERLPSVENSPVRSVRDDGEEEVCDLSVPWSKSFLTSQGVVLSNCDDQSVLIAAASLALGYRPRFVVLRADKERPDEFTHVYTEVSFNNRWWGMDSVVPHSYVGWEPPARFGRGYWRI